jgi:hypothetical protein
MNIEVQDPTGRRRGGGESGNQRRASCKRRALRARARVREIDTREGVGAATTRAVLCQRRVERAAALDDEVTSQTSPPEANDRSGNGSDPQRGHGASSWRGSSAGQPHRDERARGRERRNNRARARVRSNRTRPGLATTVRSAEVGRETVRCPSMPAGVGGESSRAGERA